jgi:hypothetical protein
MDKKQEIIIIIIITIIIIIDSIAKAASWPAGIASDGQSGASHRVGMFVRL